MKINPLKIDYCFIIFKREKKKWVEGEIRKVWRERKNKEKREWERKKVLSNEKSIRAFKEGVFFTFERKKREYHLMGEGASFSNLLKLKAV